MISPAKKPARFPHTLVMSPIRILVWIIIAALFVPLIIMLQTDEVEPMQILMAAVLPIVMGILIGRIFSQPEEIYADPDFESRLVTAEKEYQQKIFNDLRGLGFDDVSSNDNDGLIVTAAKSVSDQEVLVTSDIMLEGSRNYKALFMDNTSIVFNFSTNNVVMLHEKLFTNLRKHGVRA